MGLLEGLAARCGTQHADLTYSTTTGGNVFTDHKPQTPDVCVCLFATGGPEADTKLGYDTRNVQVLIRGDHNPSTSRTLAQAIYDDLHGLHQTTLADSDATKVLDCVGIQAGPTSLGADGNGRHEHTLNFRVEIRNTTSRD